MSEKLVLQDLVDALSKKSNITKKDADLFFREFFQLILERIFDDEIVKIRDFGTFKLTAISSRESIDVNTGEKIEIPAHQRLTFLPDKTLKNLVNKPFSHFETILLNDDIDIDLARENDADDDFIENKIDEPEEVNTPKENIDKKDSKHNKQLSSAEGVIPNINRSTKSFVYTYTTGSTKNETVVVSVSKEDLLISNTDNPKIERHTDKIEIETDSIQLNKEDINSIDTDDYFININPKPTKDNDLVNRATENKNVSLDKDSEMETVESLTDYSPEYVQSDVYSKPFDTKDQTNTSAKSEKKILDKPLIPIDKDSKNRHTTEINFDEPLIHNDLLRDLVDSDDIERDEQENDDTSFFEDYYNDKPSLKSKLIRYSPMILVIIIALGLGIYMFIKLFDVKYEFEDFLGQRNFTLTDTLPLVNEASAMNLDIDSVSPSVIESNESATDIPLDSKLPAYIQSELGETNQDTITPTQPDNNSLNKIQKSNRIISPLLDIGIVNKGAFYLKKHALAKIIKVQEESLKNTEQTSTEEKIESPEYKYVTLSKGTTLRSLATKYYGNSVYWVYIYQANKAKLSNPNVISAGMRIQIPELSTYGIKNPESLEDIKVAKMLESQLTKL